MNLKQPKSHCSRGHALTDDNVLIYSGSRRCRTCAKERANEWRAANPERARHLNRFHNATYAIKNPDKLKDYRLRRDYGITLVEFKAMYESQGRKCKICETDLVTYARSTGDGPDAKFNRTNTAHIDHCHKTGKVRGILCMRCNTAVGYLLDDPKRARQVAKYLSAQEVEPVADKCDDQYELPFKQESCQGVG